MANTGLESRATPHKGWTIALASLGLFMSALDNLVVTTALPVLRDKLHASLGDLEWTVNAYNLVFACLLLAGAALGDRFGRVRVFSAGLFVFAASSAAAALSSSVGMLIAARAVQGIGGALIMPITLTLISEAFPAEKRGAAIGMWGAIAGVAVAFGPIVGGAVVQGLDWHWIFWLNVPIGVVVGVLSLMRLTESRGPRPQLDIRGLVLASAGFFAMTWGLVKVSSDGWSSAVVIAALVVGAALLAVFLLWEARYSAPMVELSLFRSRTFTSASWVNFFMYAALFGALFLMAQFFQTALGNTPLQAGLHLLAWTSVIMFVAPLAGALGDKFGNRNFIAFGMLVQAVGLAWVAAIAKPGMGYFWLMTALIVAGIGISFVFPTVSNATMNAVEPQEAGIASGTSSTLREVGGVFGVALLASVFAHPGNYTSKATFTHNFSHALWLAAALSLVGAVVALIAPNREAPVALSPGGPAPARVAVPAAAAD